MPDKQKIVESNNQPDLDVVRNPESKLEATLNVKQNGKTMLKFTEINRSRTSKRFISTICYRTAIGIGKMESRKQLLNSRKDGRSPQKEHVEAKVTKAKKKAKKRGNKAKVNEERKVSPLILVKKKETTSGQKRKYEQSATDLHNCLPSEREY